MKRARASWLPLLFVAAIASLPAARAEYADVVLNKHAEAEGVRPVVFPHWFHRIRYRCKVCHFELGFRMRAGGGPADFAGR